MHVWNRRRSIWLFMTLWSLHQFPQIQARLFAGALTISQPRQSSSLWQRGLMNRRGWSWGCPHNVSLGRRRVFHTKVSTWDAESKHTSQNYNLCEHCYYYHHYGWGGDCNSWPSHDIFREPTFVSHRDDSMASDHMTSSSCFYVSKGMAFPTDTEKKSS